MNKILVKLYIPMLGKEYDVWIPINRRIYNVVRLMVKGLNELTNGEYSPKIMPLLYDKNTSLPYSLDMTIRESGIKSGSEIVLL